VFGNDQGFGHGSRRDHDFVFGFEDPDATISLRLAAGSGISASLPRFGGGRSQDRLGSTLDPDATAQSYLDVLRQPRSAWSFEVELRPWVEKF
jgi:hypothetical protein